MVVHARQLAFDRASSNRYFDADFRLHVVGCRLSRAAVDDYRGAEIPDWQALGLSSNRTYRVFRDPVALAKAAPTFNGIPILREHVAVDAAAHRPDLVIGATGTDATFDGTHVLNAIVLWSQDAIDRVENGTAKEISSSYRYTPVIEKGNFEGVPYDIRMTDLFANHCITCPEGRCGPTCVVGDTRATFDIEKFYQRFPEIRRIGVAL